MKSRELIKAIKALDTDRNIHIWYHGETGPLGSPRAPKTLSVATPMGRRVVPFVVSPECWALGPVPCFTAVDKRDFLAALRCFRREDELSFVVLESGSSEVGSPGGKVAIPTRCLYLAGGESMKVLVQFFVEVEPVNEALRAARLETLELSRRFEEAIWKFRGVAPGVRDAFFHEGSGEPVHFAVISSREDREAFLGQLEKLVEEMVEESAALARGEAAVIEATGGDAIWDAAMEQAMEAESGRIGDLLGEGVASGRRPIEALDASGAELEKLKAKLRALEASAMTTSEKDQASALRKLVVEAALERAVEKKAARFEAADAAALARAESMGAEAMGFSGAPLNTATSEAEVDGMAPGETHFPGFRRGPDDLPPIESWEISVANKFGEPVVIEEGLGRVVGTEPISPGKLGPIKAFGTATNPFYGNRGLLQATQEHPLYGSGRISDLFRDDPELERIALETPDRALMLRRTYEHINARSLARGEELAAVLASEDAPSIAPEKRFRTVLFEEAKALAGELGVEPPALDMPNGTGFVFDSRKRLVVGYDGGEPEDQTLARDWSWVADALNAVHEEKEALRVEMSQKGVKRRDYKPGLARHGCTPFLSGPGRLPKQVSIDAFETRLKASMDSGGWLVYHVEASGERYVFLLTEPSHGEDRRYSWAVCATRGANVAALRERAAWDKLVSVDWYKLWYHERCSAAERLVAEWAGLPRTTVRTVIPTGDEAITVGELAAWKLDFERVELDTAGASPDDGDSTPAESALERGSKAEL